MDMLNKIKDNVTDQIKAAVPFLESVMVGPVIGALDSNSVRILIEFKLEGEKELVLKGAEQSFNKKIDAPAKRPVIFKFSDLKPGQSYEILYNGENVGQVNVPGDDKNEFDFGVVSCNAIEYTKKQEELLQLWKHLEKKVQDNKLDFVLHIGDQIYTDFNYWDGDRDNLFAKIEEMVKDKPVDQLSNHTEEAREIIRQQYRDTWSYKPTQYVLSHCANRMILDDHEVVDDAGKNPELSDPNSWKSWFSKEVARHVYYEYQKQLVEDVNLDDKNTQTKEFQMFKHKNCGFFVQDNRGHFLWHGDKNTKEESYLGNTQMQALKDSLSGNGYFSDCSTVFFVSPLPLVLFSERIIQVAFKAAEAAFNYDDFAQHIMFDHQQELVEILNVLRQWKEKNPIRTVSLVGGDLHMAGHHEIYYKKRPFCKQIITSPIANAPIKKYQGLIAEIAAEVEENLGNGYTFEKSNFQYANNYASINVKQISQGQIITTHLVHNKNTIQEGNKVDSVTFSKKEGATCCTMF